MGDGFRVQQIDHVELYVPDRYEAAEWCREVLGLEVVDGYEDWAAGGGPLMVSSDGGATMLALFEGEPRGSREMVGFRRVAFRVDGPGFVRFLERSENVPALDEEGRKLTSRHVVDHGKAYSIYFLDPYGNRYEVTTYNYAYVSDRLET